MTTTSNDGNQQPSVLRGDPGVDRTPTAPSLDPQSAISPITEAPTSVEALIEQHARIAVIQVQHQNASYEPTPYEANALKNMRHILRKFAAALTTALAHRQTGEAVKEDQETRVVDSQYAAPLATASENKPVPPIAAALRLAKEATNGWACYARTNKEHNEIARLHREIDALKETV